MSIASKKTAAGGGIQFSWKFDTGTGTGPATGDIRYNNAVPASVTGLEVSQTSDNGVDLTAILGLISTSTKIYIQQEDDSTKFLLASVSGTPTDNGTDWTIPVTIDDSGALPDNNAVCRIIMAGSSGGIAGSGTDNHAVRWDGTGAIQDSGVIIDDNADVTGVRDLSIRSTSYDGNILANAWGMAGIKVTGGVSNTLTDNSTAASGTVARATSVVLSAGSIDSTNSNVTYTEYFGAYAMRPAEAGGGNVTITNAYALGAEHIKVDCQTTSGKQVNLGAIYIEGTTSYTNGGFASSLTSHPAVRYSATVNFTATPSFGGNSFLFWNLAQVNYTNADTTFAVGPNYSLVDQKLVVNSHGTAAKAALVDASFFYQPQFRATGSGTITYTSGHAALIWPRVDSNVTFTRFSGVRMDNPTLTNSLATTAGAMTNLAGIEIGDLTAGGTSNTAILFGANTPPPAGNWGIYQANSTVNQWGGGHNFKVTNITAALNLSTGTNGTANMVINCTSGTFTVTLPAGASAIQGRIYIINNEGAGTITVGRNSSNIGGTAADITLVGANTKALLIYDGNNNWMRIV